LGESIAINVHVRVGDDRSAGLKKPVLMPFSGRMDTVRPGGALGVVIATTFSRDHPVRKRKIRRRCGLSPRDGEREKPDGCFIVRYRFIPIGWGTTTLSFVFPVYNRLSCADGMKK
jgi:hypothetical protein